jgi:hypothetical protein
MSFPKSRALFLAAALLAATAAIGALDAPVAPVLSAAQVVQRMMERNQIRSQGLSQYVELRHYQVDYRGIKNLSARMEVEVTFDAASGKTMRLVSQEGSRLLCDRVLKKLIESEKEAGKDKTSTALTPANYRFESAGVESIDGRPAYILRVEPLTASKFLYVGKIWIDAADFAVAKIEAEPAKSPSFWIKQTIIHHTYARSGGFWLPRENRSETKVRLGGTAILTIDYGTPKTVPEMASGVASAALAR